MIMELLAGLGPDNNDRLVWSECHLTMDLPSHRQHIFMYNLANHWNSVIYN